MKHCKAKNLKQLFNLVEKKELFGKKLKKKTFLCFIEILGNVCSKGSSCYSCFPKRLLKKLKKQKVEVRKFIHSKTSVSKRKKKFIKSSEKFKDLIYSVLNYFFNHCVESC